MVSVVFADIENVPEYRFDFNPAPHYHVRCNICGRIADVKMPALQSPESAVEDACGFKILRMNWNLRASAPIA